MLQAAAAWLRPRLLTVWGVVISLLTATATVVGVLFEVKPQWAPCLGGMDAAFTGAPVFPDYTYRQFLTDLGRSSQGYPRIVGAEVRWTYKVSDLRDEKLVVRYTLVRVARDGSILSADTNRLDENDLFRVAFAPGVNSLTPTSCSASGGYTFFAHRPLDTVGRYKLILEMFVGAGLTHRVVLGETQTFTF